MSVGSECKARYLSKKEQDAYQQYLSDKAYGRILSPEGLKIVCESLHNNPEEIGKHFLEVLNKFQRDGVV